MIITFNDEKTFSMNTREIFTNKQSANIKEISNAFIKCTTFSIDGTEREVVEFWYFVLDVATENGYLLPKCLINKKKYHREWLTWEYCARYFKEGMTLEDKVKAIYKYNPLFSE